MKYETRSMRYEADYKLYKAQIKLINTSNSIRDAIARFER